MSNGCENCGNDNLQVYNFEMMVSLACNMRCSYCYSEGNLEESDNAKGKMQRDVFDWCINEIKNRKKLEYLKDYDLICGHFFGGEPSLSVDYMEEIMDYFADDDDVIFKTSTNGLNLDKMERLINKYSGKYVKKKRFPKFEIQISYDGNPIHDIKRKDCNGNPTSERVKDFIKYMQKNNYIYAIKSTVTFDTFKYLYEAYRDVIDVTNGEKEYFPTIDFSECVCNNIRNAPREEKDNYIKDLEKSVMKISKEELRLKNRNNGQSNPMFSWLTSNRSLCKVGDGYITINIDGKIYPCHSGAYFNKDSFTSIYEKDYQDKILNFQKFIHNLKYDPQECRDCETEYCLRCQINAYDLSEKETEEEKYLDYPHREFHCELYKKIGKIKKAYDFVSK